MYLFWYLNFANNDHATYLSRFRRQNLKSFNQNKIALQKKLKAQTETSDSSLFFEMTYLPRKKERGHLEPSYWAKIFNVWGQARPRGILSEIREQSTGLYLPNRSDKGENGLQY